MVFPGRTPPGGRAWGSQSDRVFKYVTSRTLSVTRFGGLSRHKKIADVIVLPPLTVSFL